MIDGIFDFWPQHSMGPKVLNKEEVFEILVSYHIWNNTNYTTFEEGARLQRENINIIKIKLNDLYSYFKRLRTLSELDKLYLAKQKKYENYNRNLTKCEHNLRKNLNLAKDLISDLQEIEINGSGLMDASYKDLARILEPKKTWAKNELIWTKSQIDATRSQLDSLKYTFDKAISSYNKLKRKAGIV